MWLPGDSFESLKEVHKLNNMKKLSNMSIYLKLYTFSHNEIQTVRIQTTTGNLKSLSSCHHSSLMETDVSLRSVRSMSSDWLDWKKKNSFDEAKNLLIPTAGSQFISVFKWSPTGPAIPIHWQPRILQVLCLRGPYSRIRAWNSLLSSKMICSEYHMENGTYINNIRPSSNRLAQLTAEVKAYETVIFFERKESSSSQTTDANYS